MKKIYFLFLFALIASVSNLWAAEKTVTFDAAVDESSTATLAKDKISMTYVKGTWTGSYYRTDNGSSMTVSSECSITKIVFTCPAKNTSKGGPGNYKSSVGNYSYKDYTGTWSGSATSIKFTASTNQVRATKIEVTYEAPEETKCTTPTFNLENNGEYTDAQDLVISTETEGATISYTITGVNNETPKTGTSTENTVTIPLTDDDIYTVKATAKKKGLEDSDEKEITFSIEKKCAVPTFTPAARYVKLGDAITFASATEEAVISYKYSYNGGEYSEFAEGTSFTPDKNGTYKIIAKASKSGFGDGVSEEQTYVVANVVFYESFDGNNTQGGNDGNWQQGSGDFNSDNEGWTAEGKKMYGAYKCARFGTGSAVGAATTPALTRLKGDVILSFRAGAWDGDGNTLTVSISKGEILGNASFKLENAAFKDYSVSIVGADATSKITFSVDKKRFFLDEVKVFQATVASPVATLGFKAAEIEERPWIAEKDIVLTGEVEEDVNASCLKLTCEDGAQIEYTLSSDTESNTTTKTVASGTEITLEEGVLYELTVYAIKDGEKSFSRDYTFSIGDTSSVSSVSSKGVKVIAAEGGIEVNADEVAEVAVYTAAGQLVRSARVAEGSTMLNVAPGFYVVRANGAATKVVVR